MLLKDLQNDGVEPYSGSIREPDVNEAANLFYELLDGSYKCSRDTLEIEDNGSRKTIRTIYWECKELLERVEKGGDKTAFLAMSVIEHAYRLSRPMLLTRVEDILDGNLDMAGTARKLEKALSENAYAKIWAEKAEAYKLVLAKLGFDPNAVDYSDLTEIMDPLLNAFGFYSERTNILLVRDGVPSKSKSPEVARAICMFQSEKEFVDSIMSSGKDAVMAFGAIEKTNAQIKDHFTEWLFGRPEERQYNWMKHENITAEEYLSQPANHTRKVFLAIRSGGKCWLVHMPYQTETYAQYDDPKSKFYYGRRAGYAPYEIFWKDNAPKAVADDMALVVSRKGGKLLCELMDGMQAAWFPIFIDETINRFFKSEQPPESKETFLPEETVAVLPDAAADEYAVVPSYSGKPAVASYAYVVPEPEILFPEDENMLMLMKHFKISAKDMVGVPILPVYDGDKKKYDGEIEGRVKTAYVKMLAKKAAEFLEDRWIMRRWILERIWARSNNLLQEWEDGKYAAFSETIVDGEPILDKDGNPKKAKRDRYPWDEIFATVRTSPDDGKMHTHEQLALSHRPVCIWNSQMTSSRPPVVVKLNPMEPQDIAMITGTTENDLPEMLKLYSKLARFQKEHKREIPDSIQNEWYAKGYGEKQESCFCPPIARVNICMTKKAYKPHAGLKEKEKARNDE